MSNPQQRAKLLPSLVDIVAANKDFRELTTSKEGESVISYRWNLSKLPRLADPDHIVAEVSWRVFDDLDDLDTLNTTIEILRKQVNETHDSLKLSRIFSDLAFNLGFRCRVTGDQNDLFEAWPHIEKAYSLVSGHKLQHYRNVATLFTLQELRYMLYNDMASFDTAIRQLDQLEVGMASNATDLSALLNSRATLYQRVYDQTRDRHYLVKAGSFAWDAVSISKGLQQERSRFMSNLSNCHIRLFGLTGNYVNLYCSITMAKWAIMRDPTSRCSQRMQNDLANRLDVYYLYWNVSKENPIQRADVPRASQEDLINQFHTPFDDVEQSFDMTKTSLDGLAHNHPDRSSRLNSMAMRYLMKYRFRGREIDDINEALRFCDLAIKAVPEGSAAAATLHTHKSIHQSYKDKHSTLSNVFSTDSELFPVFLSWTISQTFPRMPEVVLSAKLVSEGRALLDKCDDKGSPEDIEKAITLFRKAMKISEERSTDSINAMNCFSCALQYRYERFGRFQDLNDAIQLDKRQLKIVAPKTEARIRCLSGLGLHLQMRYSITAKKEDLDDSIQILQEAVDVAASEGYSLHPPWNDLASSLSTRAKLMRCREDLDRAIELSLTAWERIVPTRFERSTTCMNISGYYAQRYDLTGQMYDLDEAISWSRKAISTYSQQPLLSAQLWNNLGSALSRKLSALDKDSVPIADYDELAQQTIDVLVKGWESIDSGPLDRLLAARNALSIAGYHRNAYRHGPVLARQVITFLPAMGLRALEQQDRQRLLQTFHGLASDACAIQLRCVSEASVGSAELAENAGNALVLLEEGREAIIALLLDDREDLTNLSVEHPELANELETYRNALSGPFAPTYELPEAQSPGREGTSLSSPFQLLTQYNRTVDGIRMMPGWSDFLKPPTLSKLQAAASSSGAIVIVNIHEARSDAIIVTRSALRPVPLPNSDRGLAVQFKAMTAALFGDTSVPQFSLFRSAFKKERLNRRQWVHKALAWLWCSTVHPVLVALTELGITNMHGISGPPKVESLPHIHWIPVGTATSLPFHAAGLHDWYPRHKTSTFMVSSYVPSIRVLLHAQRRSPPTTTAPPRLLLTTMPTTPGESSLLGTVHEAASIQQKLRDSTIGLTSLTHPSAASVLQALKTHDMFHYAGHGASLASDPGASHLILQRSDATTRQVTQDPLSVQTLMAHDFQPARLAFLSACSTAANPMYTTVDESLHLASGFLVAGFANVVASLWPVDDRVCVLVAQHFYARLRTAAETSLAGDAIARCLHAALRDVEELPGVGLGWAWFVHFGV